MTFTSSEVGMLIAGLFGLLVFLWGVYRYVENKIAYAKRESDKALVRCRATMDARVDGVDTRVTDLSAHVSDHYLHKDHLITVTKQIDGVQTSVGEVHGRIDDLYQFMAEATPSGD